MLSLSANTKFMPTKSEPKDLKAMGLVTTYEVQKKLRISQPTLSRWVKSGAILRLSHGLYDILISKIASAPLQAYRLQSVGYASDVSPLHRAFSDKPHKGV